jgi:hypothetical protein
MLAVGVQARPWLKLYGPDAGLLAQRISSFSIGHDDGERLLLPLELWLTSAPQPPSTFCHLPAHPPSVVLQLQCIFLPMRSRLFANWDLCVVHSARSPATLSCGNAALGRPSPSLATRHATSCFASSAGHGGVSLYVCVALRCVPSRRVPSHHIPHCTARTMFQNRCRLRTDGMYYIATTKVLRSTQEGRGMKEKDKDLYSPGGLWVTTYRLLRFFADGNSKMIGCGPLGSGRCWTRSVSVVVFGH